MIQVQKPKKLSPALEKEISFTKYLYLMILASDENEEQQEQEGMERVLPERRNGSPTTLREITNSSSKRKEEEINEKSNLPRHSSKNPSGDLEYIIVEMNDLEVQSEKKTSE
jgi:tRNA(Ser,Leu) C12 N-acetylase TAN1